MAFPTHFFKFDGRRPVKELRPLLTVVMPVFNAERHLTEAIQSVLSQTYDYFQFVIVDDGSTDESGTIIKRFVSNDPRIVVLRQSNSVTAAYPVVQWLGLTGTMAGLLFCQILMLLVLWHAVRKELAA